MLFKKKGRALLPSLCNVIDNTLNAEFTFVHSRESASNFDAYSPVNDCSKFLCYFVALVRSLRIIRHG